VKLAKRTIDESVRDLDVGVVEPLAGTTSSGYLVHTEMFISAECRVVVFRSIVFFRRWQWELSALMPGHLPTD